MNDDRAFQQYGIPEPVPQPQVNTYRCKHIRQIFLQVVLISIFFMHPKASFLII